MELFVFENSALVDSKESEAAPQDFYNDYRSRSSGVKEPLPTIIEEAIEEVTEEEPFLELEKSKN